MLFSAFDETWILPDFLNIPTCYFVSTRLCFCNFEQGAKPLCEGSRLLGSVTAGWHHDATLLALPPLWVQCLWMTESDVVSIVLWLKCVLQYFCWAWSWVGFGQSPFQCFCWVAVHLRRTNGLSHQWSLWGRENPCGRCHDCWIIGDGSNWRSRKIWQTGGCHWAGKRTCQQNETRCPTRIPQHCLAHKASDHWLRWWLPPGMHAAIQSACSVDVRCRCALTAVRELGRILCHCKGSPQRPCSLVWGSQTNARGTAQELWSESFPTQADAKAHCLEGRHEVHTTTYAGRYSPSVCARCAWTPSCRVASAPSWKHSATTGVIHWECCCLTRAVSRNHWQELGCWYYSVLLCSDCSVVASACPWKVSSTSWHLQPCCRHSGKAEVVPDFTKQCKGIWAHWTLLWCLLL